MRGRELVGRNIKRVRVAKGVSQEQLAFDASVDRRPRAAFCSIRFDFEELDGATLARLMQSLIAGGDEEEGTYQLDGYRLSDAMKHLNASRELSIDEMASLEVAMVDALTHNEYGIPI